jgi:lipoyl(octanoyl) transferase
MSRVRVPLSALFFLTMKNWIYIRDDYPLPGAWNMAADEFIFQGGLDQDGTVVRFYAWERPTVSLGYSQRIDRVVDRAYCRDNGIDIVRRITGGKLVLHHREVTYSICSSDKDIFGSNLPVSYRKISEALMRGLSTMGLRPQLADSPPMEYVRGSLPCFSYPAKNEIEVEGGKIVGSAQKRVGDRFLQHGSIPLVEENDRLERVSLLNRGRERIRMISLERALGREVAFSEAVDAFAAGIEQHFGIRLKSRAFTDEERAAIQRLHDRKHAHPDWIAGRLARPGPD